MNDVSWLKIDPVNAVPSSDGQLCINIRVSFQWWRWSFLRFVRDHITIEPRWLSWLAWPMAMWIVVTHGPKMNRGAT